MKTADDSHLSTGLVVLCTLVKQMLVHFHEQLQSIVYVSVDCSAQQQCHLVLIQIQHFKSNGSKLSSHEKVIYAVINLVIKAKLYYYSGPKTCYDHMGPSGFVPVSRWQICMQLGVTHY